MAMLHSINVFLSGLEATTRLKLLGEVLNDPRLLIQWSVVSPDHI